VKSFSRLDLLLYLNSLGPIVPLNGAFEPRRVQSELQNFKDHWKPYNPRKPGLNRWGLSLTSLDGGMSGVPDLDSLKEYNSLNGTSYSEDQFTVRTPALMETPELRKVLDLLPPLGRSHLLRLGKGGFFPPHRDTAWLEPECFRVFANLNFTRNSHSFVLDQRQYFLDPGCLFVINTTLAHSLVSFHDFSEFLILNIPLDVESVEKINSLLEQS
jgi:hypothetical protein